MHTLKIVVSLQEDIQKLNHLLQVQLFLFIQLEGLDWKLYPYGQLAAVAPKDDLGIFIYDATLGYSLVVTHHTEHFNLDLVKVESLPEVDMAGSLFECLHHLILVPTWKVRLLDHELHDL